MAVRMAGGQRRLPDNEPREQEEQLLRGQFY